MNNRTNVSPLDVGVCEILAANPLVFDNDAHFQVIQKESRRARFASLVVLQKEICRSFPDVALSTGFESAVLELMVRPAETRRTILDHAVFRAWVYLAMRAANRRLTETSSTEDDLEEILRQFSPMVARVSSAADLIQSEREVQVLRTDGDPLIHRATPPSYEFPDNDEMRRLEKSGHPTSFLRDIIKLVLKRLAAEWPELHARFSTLVQFIYYLPDAKFRSCSASRYGGVVLLAAKDTSLRDLAETLVHEWGHQLLYLINEATPLVVSEGDNEKTFPLPWSGQERDLYGYFHAFFIYVLLVRYFDRALARDKEEKQKIENRSAFIIAGLRKAVIDLKDQNGFTAAGRAFLGSLISEVEILSRRTDDADLSLSSRPSVALAS